MHQTTTTTTTTAAVKEEEVEEEEDEEEEEEEDEQQKRKKREEEVEEDEESEDREVSEEVNKNKSKTKRRKTTKVGEDVGEMASGNCCAGCSEPIRDKFIFSVIDLHWHQDCVQCADCSLKLNERCYTFEGKLYCKLDYWRRFGPKCFACRESIEQSELVQRIKGNRVYHLKCFTCNDCHKQLKAGEQLHLIDGKKLLCKQDYHQFSSTQQQQQQSKQTSSSISMSMSLSSSSPSSSSLSVPTSKSNNSSNLGPGEHQTYYTLMTSHQAEKNKQHQQVKLEVSNRKMLSPDGDLTTIGDQLLLGEEDEPEALEEELEELDELDDEDELECDDNDQELEDGRGDGTCETLEEDMRDLLGYDNDNNNLENEENHSLFGLGLEGNGNQGLIGNSKQQHLNKKVGKQHHQQQQQQQQVINGAKKRRRRKQQQQQQQQQQHKLTESGRSRTTLVQAGKKLANRNGESILNGIPPASSILAVHPSSMGQHMQPTQVATQQHHQPGQHLHHHQHHHHNNNKSVSSSASTASNSSTSSSLSLNHHTTTTNNHHHHHQTHQQHHHQQHHNQNSNSNHHHHHHTSAGAGQQSGNNSGGGGATHKPTRVRTVLNEKQLQTLRDCYALNPRPDALMKEQLVDMTGLSPRVIRVWFQNKRCKDKKKSILYKQMQQHEKDGRHLAGLTLMRGVPMVASSPIQYDDHSTVSSTPGAQQQQAGNSMLELQPQGVGGVSAGQQPNNNNRDNGADNNSSPLMGDLQQQQARHYNATTGAVHSPASSQQQPIDIHAYQPPWKSLIDYAHQHQPLPGVATPPDRLNAASPRYQQLMGQIHGYNHNNQQQANEQSGNEQTGGGGSRLVVELQPQQRQQLPLQPQFSQANSATSSYPQQNQSGAVLMGAEHQRHNNNNHHHNTHLGLGQPPLPPQPPPQSQPMSQHLHQFQQQPQQR